MKKNILICLLFVWIGACTHAQKSKTTAPKPNIIYILVDDMGYGDLGCYGQTHFSTPTLDRMAAEGIRFTQHYAGSPVCAPSRASLMTGRDPGHCRVRGNYETGPYGFGSGLELRPQDVTLGEVLKTAGYRTAVIGKWGLGMDGSTGEPTKQGFDYMYGFLNQAHAHYQYPDYLFRNGKKESVVLNENNKRGYYSNDIFTDEALKYVKEQKKDQPFFLYLAYVTPHAEMLVPEDSLFNSFKGKFPEKPYVMKDQGGSTHENLGAYNSQAYPAAAYATMVVRIDRDVAKLMSQLKALGMDENTVIMFSSDNGPHKEGGAHPSQHNSAGPLKGAKRDLYEGGIREPFIVRWPAKIPAKQTTDHISGFWDVMPTVAEMAGINLTKNKIPTEGISLMPVLTGKPKAQKQHSYMYWEFHENKTSDQAVRKGNWKAIRHDPDGKTELYDLSTDIGETKNVAAEHPEVVKEMEAIMATAREDHEIWPMKRSSKPTQTGK